MKTTAFLYRWTQLSTGMWYEGSHSRKGCHPDNGYLCSSLVVEPMIISDPQDWQRQVLIMGEPLYIRSLENARLESINAAADPMSYNRDNGNGAEGFSATGKSWMHLGDVEILVESNAQEHHSSLGWRFGRKESIQSKLKDQFSNYHKGSDNTAYGKSWMTNGPLHRLVDITGQVELLSEGWEYGVREDTLDLLSEKSKSYYENRTEQEADEHKKNLSTATTSYHANLTEEEYNLRAKNCSEGTKLAYKKKTKEEKEAQNNVLNGVTKTCPVCKIKCTRGNYARWGHGENCIKTIKEKA